MAYRFDARTTHKNAATPATSSIFQDAPSQRCQVSWLNQAGAVSSNLVKAPAIPLVESACANFARGTLIETKSGLMAAEDIKPGTEIMTSDHGLLPLLWSGSCEIVPSTDYGIEKTVVYRLTAESFGMGKPSQDLMLAPRAHIMTRHPACKTRHGIQQAFAPVKAFVDGMNVLAITPMFDITMFNFAFDRQATILANGVEVESFHPAITNSNQIDSETLNALLRLFPHARGLESFGEQDTARLTAYEFQELR